MRDRTRAARHQRLRRPSGASLPERWIRTSSAFSLRSARASSMSPPSGRRERDAFERARQVASPSWMELSPQRSASLEATFSRPGRALHERAATSPRSKKAGTQRGTGSRRRAAERKPLRALQYPVGRGHRCPRWNPRSSAESAIARRRCAFVFCPGTSPAFVSSSEARSCPIPQPARPSAPASSTVSAPHLWLPQRSDWSICRAPRSRSLSEPSREAARLSLGSDCAGAARA